MTNLSKTLLKAVMVEKFYIQMLDITVPDIRYFAVTVFKAFIKYFESICIFKQHLRRTVRIDTAVLSAIALSAIGLDYHMSELGASMIVPLIYTAIEINRPANAAAE